MIQNTNYGTSKSYVDNNIGVWNWQATHTYSADDFCIYNGKIYKSLQSNNIGNIPSASSLFWGVYESTSAIDYNCIMNFALDGSQYVCSYAGTLAGATPAKVTGITPNTTSYLNRNIGWMKELYVCTLDEDGNELHILNPYDLTKDINGNDVSAEITSADVMVHMPDCYLSLGSNAISVNSKSSYGGQRLAHTYGGVDKHDLYIGMYPATIGSDNKMHSWSGATATTSKTRSAFREAARAKNVNTTGWHQWNYHEFNLLRALQLQAMCSFNGQTSIGQGISSGGQSAIATNGALNQAGWFAGDTSGTTSPVKLIVENSWANRWQFIDDFVVDTGQAAVDAGRSPVNGVYYADCYAGNNAQTTASASSSAISDVLTDKVRVGQVLLGSSATASQSNTVITGINTTDAGWGIPGTAGGSSNTYFNDNMWSNGGVQRLLIVGGVSNDGSSCGPFAFNTNHALGLSSWIVGSRLAYIKCGSEGRPRPDSLNYLHKLFIL